jgi:methionyl aminopeptidase
MTIDSEKDLDQLKQIGRIVGQTLKEMSQQVVPGMTTHELDEIGRLCLERFGARSAPQVMYNFPGVTCISVNEEAAHGIPGKRVIQAGDLVNIDVSAELNGYYADTGATVMVPPVLPEQRKLCDFTRSALNHALNSARAGRMLNEIGRAVEREAHRGGFRVIRELGGHGVGHSLHEEPDGVANYYNPRDQRRLKEGMVVAIEPFLTRGNGHIVQLKDGWTLRTADRSALAQYEHTVVITRGQPILLTAV